jgi:hypothetical protein
MNITGRRVVLWVFYVALGFAVALLIFATITTAKRETKRLAEENAKFFSLVAAQPGGTLHLSNASVSLFGQDSLSIRIRELACFEEHLIVKRSGEPVEFRNDRINVTDCKKAKEPRGGKIRFYNRLKHVKQLANSPGE